MIDALLSLIATRTPAASRHHMVTTEFSFAAGLAGLKLPIPTVGGIHSSCLMRCPETCWEPCSSHTRGH